MTASDHANTVRDALEHPKTKWCSACEADALNDPCVCGEPDIREACAALDALQAQAEAVKPLTDDWEQYGAEQFKRAEAAEAERDRLTLALKDARRSLALEMYAGSRSKTAKIIEDALADDTCEVCGKPCPPHRTRCAKHLLNHQQKGTQ